MLDSEPTAFLGRSAEGRHVNTCTEFTNGTKVRHMPHSSGDLGVHRCLCIMTQRDVMLSESQGRDWEAG